MWSYSLLLVLSLWATHCLSDPLFFAQFEQDSMLVFLRVLVSPCPGPRDTCKLKEERVVGGGCSGRVNQCFPIWADMHFTRRDSPQPANWFKLFYWLNWCHPFVWSITARKKAFPFPSPFRAAAVHPGQGQVKEPRRRTQRKTTNRAGPSQNWKGDASK
jgi:hypothetical protein